MDPQCVPYQKLSIYQTKARLYIVGYCKMRSSFSFLKLSKQEPTQLDVAEVAGNYSLQEIRAMLSQINAANAHLGGLQLVTHVSCVPQPGTPPHSLTLVCTSSLHTLPKLSYTSSLYLCH